MTAKPEMTAEDLAAHALAIAASKTEESFVKAFGAYVRDVVERETEPYDKIALFVRAMMEGQGVIIDALARHRAGSAQG